MMIVAACASVGSGPSDARPEHYHGGGSDASVGFTDSKSNGVGPFLLHLLPVDVTFFVLVVSVLDSLDTRLRCPRVINIYISKCLG